jgi:hypothetical protein
VRSLQEKLNKYLKPRNAPDGPPGWPTVRRRAEISIRTRNAVDGPPATSDGPPADPCKRIYTQNLHFIHFYTYKTLSTKPNTYQLISYSFSSIIYHSNPLDLVYCYTQRCSDHSGIFKLISIR